MGRIIAITSGKGGTGKTTSAAAIASCLAYLGFHTVCMDGDIGLKNLDLVLGLADAAVTDFTDVMAGRVPLENAVIPHPDIRNLWLLSAPVSQTPEDIHPSDMDRLKQALRQAYDYTIIDAPAGIGTGFRLCAAGADMAIVVSGGEPASLRDAERTTAELYAMGLTDVRLLVNRYRRRLLRWTHSTVDDYIDRVGARLVGIVSEDESIAKAAARETALVLCDSKAAFQFLRVAKRIIGQKVPVGSL
jgi:septum site-determining protein MinD